MSCQQTKHYGVNFTLSMSHFYPPFKLNKPVNQSTEDQRDKPFDQVCSIIVSKLLVPCHG